MAGRPGSWQACRRGCCRRGWTRRSRDPGVGRPPGVVHPDHALEHERAAPLLAQPAHVVPGRQRGPSTARTRRRTWGAAPRAGHVRDRQVGGLPVRAKPASQRGRISTSGANRTMVLRSRRSGMAGLPQSRPMGERPVQGQDQPHRPGGAGPLDAAAICSRDPGPVDLEERLGVGRNDLLERLAGERAQAHGRPRAAAARATATSPSGCTACTPVGEMITGSETRLAHDRGGQLALWSEPVTCGDEAELAEGRDVVASVTPSRTPPAARCTPRRQPPLRPPLRLGDRLEPVARRPLSFSDRRPRTRPAGPRRRPGRRRTAAERLLGRAREWSAAGRGSAPARGLQLLAVAQRHIGIRPVERQPGEELSRHAAAAAGVVEAAAERRPRRTVARADRGNSSARARRRRSRRAGGRCRPGTPHGSRTGRRRRRRPGRSGRPRGRRRKVQAGQPPP